MAASPSAHSGDFPHALDKLHNFFIVSHGEYEENSTHYEAAAYSLPLPLTPNFLHEFEQHRLYQGELRRKADDFRRWVENE
ncbi:hypothetical protein SK128_007144 [Halocaridina rubra]|uniref:Uncharacterized protein n=1 Tax=Halocaridina rubra TaxID=373956 RepID=A0AAN9FUI5_HALRR